MDLERRTLAAIPVINVNGSVHPGRCQASRHTVNNMFFLTLYTCECPQILKLEFTHSSN